MTTPAQIEAFLDRLLSASTIGSWAIRDAAVEFFELVPSEGQLVEHHIGRCLEEIIHALETLDDIPAHKDPVSTVAELRRSVLGRLARTGNFGRPITFEST